MERNRTTSEVDQGLHADFWNNRRVVVTGGGGFLGCYIIEKLRKIGVRKIVIPRSAEYDLTKLEAIMRLYKESRPDLVIHLAARVGGIGANQKTPATFFYDNLIMGVQLIEVGRQIGLKKLVATGTVCAYPKFATVPFREEEIWNGYPEETNAPYGLAKKMLSVQSAAYRQQYGFNSIVVYPANLYGPRDNFDPEMSHVIPALIRKVDEAIEKGKNEVVLWGDGTPTREFLFVEDAAEGVLRAAEHYDSSAPLNLGSGKEISIAQLAQEIAGIMGYSGRFVYDTSRPNGQPRRALDVTRARREIGFKPKVPLSEGLRRTISWWREQRSSITVKTISRQLLMTNAVGTGESDLH